MFTIHHLVRWGRVRCRCRTGAFDRGFLVTPRMRSSEQDVAHGQFWGSALISGAGGVCFGRRRGVVVVVAVGSSGLASRLAPNLSMLG